MALQITCPTCGRRPVSEYRFGGEVPVTPEHVTDADAHDVDRVWMRTNAEGITVERWYHEAGCRRWLTLERDTRD